MECPSCLCGFDEQLAYRVFSATTGSYLLGFHKKFKLSDSKLDAMKIERIELLILTSL